MKLKNITEIKDFLAAANQCTGDVYLLSPEGDKYNLKSSFSQYVAIGALLRVEGDNLELFCSKKEDEQYFFAYFNKHPEVN